ncbi:MAG: TIR domain-containing protein [bacterium]|nr:TIR domain-containing protein [bacterium]
MDKFHLEKVFISHTHADHVLAKAIDEILKKLFKNVEVEYSSNKSIGGGIEYGANWLDWIYRQVLDCQETLVLVTPQSFLKPWPMWEAGAVAGVALASSASDATEQDDPSAKNVTPLVFRMGSEGILGPFVTTKIVNAEEPEDLKKILGDWMRKYDHREVPQNMIDLTLKEHIPTLLNAFRSGLQNTPPPISEGLIQEWCRRLDNLTAEGRFHEVRYLHRWIGFVFDGPPRTEEDQDKPPTPWDLRIHQRLGELYMKANQMSEAQQQFELASRLAPLDIFVLHKLGQTHLNQPGQSHKKDVRKVLDRILELDVEAFDWNAECAGLEGRYWKEEGGRLEKNEQTEEAKKALEKSRQAYQKVLDNDERSYYTADNVGQLCLRLGDEAGARQAYEKANAALKHEPRNIWSLATRINVALAYKNDLDEAERLLAEIHSENAPEFEKNSIRKGLRIVMKGMKISKDSQNKLIGILG